MPRTPSCRTVSIELTPPPGTEAEILAEELVVTVLVVIGNVTVVDCAGITMVDGTVATPVFELRKVTVIAVG